VRHSGLVAVGGKGVKRTSHDHLKSVFVRAILAGERAPEVLASLRDSRCHASAETIAKALTGNYRSEHLFALVTVSVNFDLIDTLVEQKSPGKITGASFLDRGQSNRPAKDAH